jgi:hypothetical protein
LIVRLFFVRCGGDPVFSPNSTSPLEAETDEAK